MVHLSDLDWNLSGEEAAKQYSKGDVVKLKVLDVDVDKDRASLGIKQLGEDPFAGSTEKLKKGDVVTGTVQTVTYNGMARQVGEGARGGSRTSQHARDRREKQP